MIGTFLASTAGKLLFYALIAGLATGGYFYWQHVVASRALLVEQNKQLIQVIAERDKARAEQNATWARLMSVPAERQRICATRPADDGCCFPAPRECKP